MSKATATVRYDGPALAGHTMDVVDLAPALLGLSELVKTANKQINGDRSQVRVLVSVDAEHKCFEFVIEIAQTVAQRLTTLVESEPVATAKEIAEWIGIIGGASSATGFGLFRAYKWLVRQKTTLSELAIDQDGSEVTIRNVNANNNSITINANTYNLLSNRDVVDSVKDVVRPLTNVGYDSLQFEKDGKVADEISSDDGRDICSMDPESLEVQQRINKSTIEAKVKVKRPDFLGDSQWSVIYDKAIMARIEDSRWLDCYHNAEVDLPPGSFLHVKMRMESRLNEENEPIGEPRYFIVEVLSVIPPDQQGTLFTDL